MRQMATFTAWLESQAGRGDEVGRVASAWRDAKGRRPRASAPSTVTRFMLADPDQVPGMDAARIEAVLVAAVAQFHNGNHQAGPAVPSPPLGPDLQPVRLASVPDHQEPPQAGDGETADSPKIDLTQSMATSPQVMEVLQNFDERLAGLQELVGAVPAIHELLVAFMQAMAPLMELAGEARAAMDAHPGPAMSVAPSTMADQLGITPAQQAARDVAQQNGWIDSQPYIVEAGSDPQTGDFVTRLSDGTERRQRDWASGLCEIHCREDRCVYGCDCPGHLSDGSHVTQTRNPGAMIPADQGMRLYGDHIAPEPDWARYHDLGEPR